MTLYPTRVRMVKSGALSAVPYGYLVGLRAGVVEHVVRGIGLDVVGVHDGVSMNSGLLR